VLSEGFLEDAEFFFPRCWEFFSRHGSCLQCLNCLQISRCGARLCLLKGL
jgi:hypothetical protein